MELTSRKTSTARNRRFRERVAEMGYRRMEITAAVPTIKLLRAVAKARKIATYEALELAVDLMVKWHNDSCRQRGSDLRRG